jgi:hypothetical protein
MCDPARTLALAQRFRHNAQETRLPEFARLMLRTAEDLELLARSQDVTFTAQLPQRKTC